MTGPALHGVVGTPVTPFAADGSLDMPSFETLVDYLVQTGVDAVGIPMHIGESLNLSEHERRRVAEAAVKTIDGRVPLIVNTSLSGTDQVVALSRHAQEVGAAAVVVVTPYHWAPPHQGLREHYLAIGRSIDIDLLAYNYPAKLGAAVSVPLVRELIDELPNFVGVKDASLSMEYVSELCAVGAQLRPGFSVFTGVEYFLPGMALGCVGAFSAVGAVAPRLVRSLHDACAAGDYQTARKLQHQVSALWVLLQVGYPAAIKAAMEIMGRPVGRTRLPIPSLKPAETSALEGRLAELGVLEDEPHGWSVSPAAAHSA